MLGLITDTGSRTYFEFSRMQTMEQWWQWPLFFLLGILIILFVVALYRRDTEDLGRPLRWLLTVRTSLRPQPRKKRRALQSIRLPA